MSRQLTLPQMAFPRVDGTRHKIMVLSPSNDPVNDLALNITKPLEEAGMAETVICPPAPATWGLVRSVSSWTHHFRAAFEQARDGGMPMQYDLSQMQELDEERQRLQDRLPAHDGLHAWSTDEEIAKVKVAEDSGRP
ncbi:MAG: hypothetical protein M1826_006340 [Phylliscum demangeonii]|nr:MAG: hypothetical protein M1826_006340 [Phylliscum demangeonii]